MTKSYADIRKALVEGIRNNPQKPYRLKCSAEVLIACIDNMDSADPQALEQFQVNYAFFARAAGNTPVPLPLSPAEIAKAFGLVPRHQ